MKMLLNAMAILLLFVSSAMAYRSYLSFSDGQWGLGCLWSSLAAFFAIDTASALWKRENIRIVSGKESP